ncbi:uncharacterized protein LOC129757284 isoform X2 [Uranotaenia lowii]|uniref:uncharacterized protein LOC129757284 isoform X2 n=1 Tax=Uranotaenia lowii TaxID=190385 RepID=UPI00247A5B72|nr:uncharacterized protein LOC129757284 isoform X2 [Uranotaenia lowii]
MEEEQEIQPTVPESSNVQQVYVLQSDMDRLTNQRNHASNRISHIIETMEAFQNDVVMIETRRDMLKQAYTAYDAVQNSLEQLMPDEISTRDAVELKYIAGMAAFEKTINNQKKTDVPPISKDAIRLPTIDLPKFSGSSEQWLEWHDKFNSLIHSRAIPGIQKLEYLKVSLRGPALAIIDSLPTTENNYQIAYDLLTRRYNNPKQLIQQHVRELFELKPVETESAANLRVLFDSARKHIRCLQILEQPVQSWDAMLIHMMSNKLDAYTRRQWETAASGVTPPTYEQLESFVLDRCQVIEAISVKRKNPYENTAGPLKRVKNVVVVTVEDATVGIIPHFIGTIIESMIPSKITASVINHQTQLSSPQHQS